MFGHVHAQDSESQLDVVGVVYILVFVCLIWTRESDWLLVWPECLFPSCLRKTMGWVTDSCIAGWTIIN